MFSGKRSPGILFVNGVLGPPSTCIRFCLKTNIFPRFGLHGVHTYPVKTVTEKGIFFSPEWRFLKTQASHLRVDGLKQRFSASMM